MDILNEEISKAKELMGIISEQKNKKKKVTHNELMRGIDMWCKDNGFDGKGSRTYKTNTVPVYEDVDGVVIEGLMGLIEDYCYLKDS